MFSNDGKLPAFRSATITVSISVIETNGVVKVVVEVAGVGKEHIKLRGTEDALTFSVNADTTRK